VVSIGGSGRISGDSTPNLNEENLAISWASEYFEEYAVPGIPTRESNAIHKLKTLIT
jgi:hypothetical protein